MQPLIDFYKNSEQLHHAYFFVTHKVDEIVSKLKHFLENTVGIKTSGNPDFQHLEFKTFNIEHARALATSQENRDFSFGKKIFIIQTDFITEEAQNALLKVFEEPTAGTHFFIISPQDILLPTFRSRMNVVIHNENTLGSPTSKSILDLKLPERLVKVKEIIEAISDEEKTKQDAIFLLNQIEKELYKKGVEKSVRELKICEETRQALYDRGAPVKMILENMMLNI